MPPLTAPSDPWGMINMKTLTSLSLVGQDGGHKVWRAGSGQSHPHWNRHDARDADAEVSERLLILPPSDLNCFTFSENEVPFPWSQSW